LQTQWSTPLASQTTAAPQPEKEFVVKILLRVSLVLVLCLAFAGVSAAAKYDSFFVEGSGQHCITYDGYCDGICYSVYAGGSADGYQTGCISGALFGTVGGRALHASYACDAQFGCDVEGPIHTIVRNDGTWAHYIITGGAVSLLNSGTWTPGTPRIIEGLPASVSK
jgi:hypothetical protein